MRTIRVALLIVGLGLSAATVVPTSPAGADGCSTTSDQSCAPATAKPSGPRAMIGKAAPATVGPDLTGTGTVDVGNPDGTPTAVVFWLNTCPHCQAALPMVDRLGAKLGTRRRIVTAVIDRGADGPAGPAGFETPAAAVETLDLTLPTALVTTDQADQWQIESTPTAYVVDARGKVRAVVLPSDDPAQFTKALQRALKRTG